VSAGCFTGGVGSLLLGRERRGATGGGGRLAVVQFKGGPLKGLATGERKRGRHYLMEGNGRVGQAVLVLVPRRRPEALMAAAALAQGGR
jgi:hypothetical protein